MRAGECGSVCACLWGGAGGVAQAPPRPEAALSLSFRLVSIHQSGWKAFDVTEAVNFWQQLREPRQPLLLQVSVHREHLGAGASSAHRLVRFAWQGEAGGMSSEPQVKQDHLEASS